MDPLVIRKALLKDRVAVQTYQGETSHGPVLADEPITVLCMRDSRRKLVQTATGDEVVSEQTLFLLP